MDPQESIVGAWRTNSRATSYLIEHLPQVVWEAKAPEIPTRPIRSIAAHLHNSRCNWIRTLGREHGIAVPLRVDRREVTPRQLADALERSDDGIAALLELGWKNGGVIPPSKGYVWRNLPLDVGHVLAYFAAHEGHHRGQIVMAARQLGHRLPTAVTNGLWQWSKRAREPAGRR